MPIVTAAQQKGGVGKTSVIINLACQAIARGKTAAILDMDTEQGSATKWGERRKKAGLNGPAVYTVKTSGLAQTVKTLRDGGIEWIFIDSPGRDAPASSAAMQIANLVLVPCRPLEEDIEPSFATVSLLRTRKGRYAYLMNIVPIHGEKARARKVGAVLEGAGHPVSPIIIVQRLGVPDASARGMGANEKDPGGTSDQEYGELFAWIESELAQ